jgi:hypothetical protein
MILGLCSVRTVLQNFLALKPTFAVEVTTVQSDDSNLALMQANGVLLAPAPTLT